MYFHHLQHSAPGFHFSFYEFDPFFLFLPFPCLISRFIEIGFKIQIFPFAQVFHRQCI